MEKVRTFDGRLLTVLSLEEYLQRYYKEKKVTKIIKEKNLLGESIFRRVEFENGTYITLCQGIYGQWCRHSGGGRYGSRSRYEGKIK